MAFPIKSGLTRKAMKTKSDKKHEKDKCSMKKVKN
eukprot:CAMPEP_0171181790 /NCGR_PEP_ID=MMETSP0790-20130122/14436_1 /TAXON_ID=2925 /ORGANISM="Alexandrium catenella, Strain OF101" /LENGTH=34 /DNA_ID= /DNA_START= /DNA_END= /DNA_ORIENTATION=